VPRQALKTSRNDAPIYAKGTAVGTIDVDLLVSSDGKGLKYYRMVEKLRTSLHKKVDVLSIEQLTVNSIL